MSLPARLAIPRVENLIDGYFAGGFADLSDTQLAEVIALAVSRPKVARASSFVLHAPLELLARAKLDAKGAARVVDAKGVELTLSPPPDRRASSLAFAPSGARLAGAAGRSVVVCPKP